MIIASIQAAGCEEILTLTNNQFCDITLLSLSDLKKLLTSSTIITSTLVRIPTSTVESFPNLFSVLLNLINFSLEKGMFTRALKQAIVKPYIKTLISIPPILQAVNQYQTWVIHQSYQKDQLLYNLTIALKEMHCSVFFKVPKENFTQLRASF